MSRLLSFGCSITYGYGLVDCWDPVARYFKETPSQHAWPSILGKKLKLETHNLSYPGSSNRQIWWKVVNTEFQKDDTVVFLWTYPFRYCFINQPPDHLFIPRERFGLANKDKLYQKYKNRSNDFDIEVESLTFINYTDMFLKNQGINKVYHFSVHDKSLYSHNHNWCDIKILDYAVNAWRNIQVKELYALDGEHPSQECQRLLASHMQKIIEKQET